MQLSCSINSPMRIAYHRRSFISSAVPLFGFSSKLFEPLCHSLPLLSAMTSENLSTASSAAFADKEHGFIRPEMDLENLAGTVDSYDRHVFLCYKNHNSWPPRVEASDSDPLPKLLATTVKSRKDDITIKTKITICEVREENGFSNGDVLIFPEMIKYRSLEESNIESFVEDVMVNCKPWAAGVQDVLTGSHVFVCAHGSRDMRCGVCGPALIEKFNEEIELRGLKDQVFVTACSHVGGHKYAGNLIIYSPGLDGKIMGHWYGYVTNDDVPDMLEEQIVKGKTVQRLWRGQMGPSVEEGKVMDNLKLPNGEATGKSQRNHLENGKLSNNKNVAGCCLGVNGVSCCRTASVEQNNDGKEKAEAHKKQWPKSWGRWSAPINDRNILTTVAVVGAVAAVAVAIKFYRRSG